MAEIRIERDHDLGLDEARKLAQRWAQAAEEKLDLHCTYEHGKSSDRVLFRRAGVHGELKVTRHTFVLHAKLGLLLGVFKDRIETEIVRNLDVLLAHEDPLGAFDVHVSRHASKGETQKPAPAKKQTLKKKGS